jgi:hypothetical protein
VHLQVDFVPKPVVKAHYSHEDNGSLPGHQSNRGRKWKRLDRRFAQSQTDFLVFSGRNRLITEYPGVVLLMVHDRVSFEYALEAGTTPTEKVRPVHQLAVNLVLDEGNQTAGDDDPADNPQDKHQAMVLDVVTLPNL